MQLESKHGQRFTLLGNFLDDYLPEISNGCASFATTIAGAYFGTKPGLGWPLVLLLIFAVLNIASVIWTGKKARSIRKLESKVHLLQTKLSQHGKSYSDKIEELLRLAANSALRLTDRERISLYRPHENNFTMLGRYTLNPEYLKRGRSLYPKNEGCIANAWRDGTVLVEKLPDPTSNYERYLQKQKTKANLPKNVAERLTMPSRSYFAIALTGLKSDKRVAVVVVESVREKIPNIKAIENNLANGLGLLLAHCVESLEKYEPDLSYANREGF